MFLKQFLLRFLGERNGHSNEDSAIVQWNRGFVPSFPMFFKKNPLYSDQCSNDKNFLMPKVSCYCHLVNDSPTRIRVQM